MTKQSIAASCALVLGTLGFAPVSFAGEGKETKATKEIQEIVKESCITGDIGMNIASQYISRGAIFENQGAILQPYADLYFKLYEGEGFLNKISLNLGIWNSFHSRGTDAGLVSGTNQSSTRNWYEFDFTAGIAFTFAKNFTFTPSYYTFLSPNDGFATFHGLNLSLAYDTTDLIGINLAPKVTVLFELDNKAGTGADEGVYYEVSLAPSFPIGDSGFTVTFPIMAGFGSDDFYGSLNQNTGNIDDEWFGYVTGGVTLSYALKFIPECYGTWTVSGNYAYYYMGDGTSDFNSAARGGAVRDSRHNEHIFSGGLMVAF